MMKNLLLSFVIIFSFSKTVYSQFIDGVEVTPFTGLNVINMVSSNSQKSYIKDRFGGQYPFEVIVSKKIKKDLALQLGLGYMLNWYRLPFEDVSIQFFYQDVLGQNIQMPTEDEQLILKVIDVTDSYLSIPLGIKYYLPQRDKRHSSSVFIHYSTNMLLKAKIKSTIGEINHILSLIHI